MFIRGNEHPIVCTDNGIWQNLDKNIAIYQIVLKWIVQRSKESKRK